MPANKGKPEEREIEDFFVMMGKDADLYRFEDHAEVNFKGPGPKTRKIVSAKPADYILTWGERTRYLEVKACEHPVRFALNKIRTSQWHRAKRVAMARGDYEFWIKSLHLGRWFRVPVAYMLAFRDQGKASVTWQELAPHDITVDMNQLRAKYQTQHKEQ